jgi:glycosyltransferase involved in cell wall biosynthesis
VDAAVRTDYNHPVYRELRVAVVIPAFNESRKIVATVATVPAFVDHILVIDDASADDTSRQAELAARGRGEPAGVEVIRHAANRGVGGAITTGYRRAITIGADVAVVMAGDGQMDPLDLPALLDPIAAGEADYVKGNRFLHPAIWTTMPAPRIFGNLVLSVATRVTSGYRHVFDSQCGYTAIHRNALATIELAELFPRYGYPNDLLSRLRVADMRVVDVPVRPIYGAEWRSGIHLGTALHPIPWVLLRSWGNRVAAQLRRRVRSRADGVAPRADARGTRPHTTGASIGATIDVTTGARPATTTAAMPETTIDALASTAP